MVYRIVNPKIDAMNNESEPYHFDNLKYSEVLKYLVGPEKKPRTEPYPSFGGILTPMPSPNEVRIERVMNSCLFKSVVACVGGKPSSLGLCWYTRCFICWWSIPAK